MREVFRMALCLPHGSEMPPDGVELWLVWPDGRVPCVIEDVEHDERGITVGLIAPVDPGLTLASLEWPL